MFSLVSRIFNGIQQSKMYKNQARAAQIQAQGIRNQASAQASLIEDSARRNALIDNQNLMAARSNQREQTAALKNKRATSGFTSEGTADQPILDAHEALNAEIEQMALSSSINSLNAIQTAVDTRKQGELSAMVKDMEAQAYRAQSKGIKQATIANGIVGIASAAAGAYTAYTGYQSALTNLDSAYDQGQLSPANYAAQKNALLQQNPYLLAFTAGGYYGSTGYDAMAAFNPYTTTMTRKNPWGGLYSLAKGANPGITRNNYNQLFTR